jgi:hypothetical protein
VKIKSYVKTSGPLNRRSVVHPWHIPLHPGLPPCAVGPRGRVLPWAFGALFQMFSMFHFARLIDIVEVVEAINRVTKSLVVLCFNEEVVMSIVNGFDVEPQNATLIL